MDVKGRRVYVCCPGCKARIKEHPKKYLAKIEGKGQTPMKLEWVQKQDAYWGGKKAPACDTGKGKPECDAAPKRNRKTAKVGSELSNSH